MGAPTGAVDGVSAVVGALVVWAVAAKVLSHGLPAGIVVSGLVFGSLYGLIAIGLVLIYRANRVVNFAQAQFGSVAAVVAIELVIRFHVPYFLALVVSFAIALATGAIVNALVIYRFRKASRLILSVVTIGLAQILAGLSLIIPILLNRKSLGSNHFTTPWEAKFRIWPVVFNGNYVLAILVVIGAMIAMAAFFRFSDYGVAIRAAAENGDRANLLGIPVPRLNTIVWSLAALLSAIAVILRVPIVGFGSLQDVSGGGNALLLRTLAAAVIGRMESIPRTAIAAIAIGVFDSAAIWTTHNTVIVDAMMVVVILVALLVQRDFFARAGETGISTFRAIREIRPVPEELARLPEVLVTKWVLGAAGLAFLATVPLWMRPSKQLLAGLIAVYAIVAISMVVLTGWAGHISLGQFALVGFGGSTTALLYQRHHWDYVWAVVAGVIVASVVALLIGLPALRIKGPFLAVTTLAFAVTSSTFFLEDRYFPWFVQDHMDRPVFFNRLALNTDTRIYYFCLLALGVAMLSARSLRRSRTGRALIAIRDNESAAQTFMLNATRMKLTAFVLSGAMAGFAGAIYVTHQKGIYTASFNADASIELFSMVVIGGLGSLPGAVLGASYIGIVNFLLPAGYRLLATGVGILALLLFFPEGLGGLVYGVRDTLLRKVAERRRIVVPSLVADLRVADSSEADAIIDASLDAFEHGDPDNAYVAEHSTPPPDDAVPERVGARR